MSQINSLDRLNGVIITNSDTGSQEMKVYQENHVCSSNTTATPLLANATFTGTWQDCINFQEVNVSIVSDQNSASNGLVLQWSADGINIGDTDTFSYYASSGGTNYTPNPSFRYFRIVYTNGSTPQTSFSLQTILRRSMTGGSFHRIDSTLKDDADGRLNITVPKLKTAANTYVSQTATMAGNAKMSIEEIEAGVVIPISATALPLPTGAATSAKQLADNHNVTVSNIASTPLITGFATSAKQDTIITSVQLLDNIVAGNEAQVDIVTMPAVTGTVTANAGTNLNTSALAVESGGNLASIKTNTDRLAPASTIYQGTKTVPTGTAEAIAGSQAVSSVTIKALSTNTVAIYAGSSSTTVANGFELLAGESATLEVSNLNLIYVISGTANQVIRYISV